jgi:hypothetical protein
MSELAPGIEALKERLKTPGTPVTTALLPKDWSRAPLNFFRAYLFRKVLVYWILPVVLDK